MSKTIYVWNLPRATKPDLLRVLFRRYGRISSVSIRPSDTSFTEAKVVMADEHAAEEAVHARSGLTIGNRPLDFGLERRRSFEMSWDGRSGGLNSLIE